MANATPTRVGQINSSGDVDAMFLKVFSGEVMLEFDVMNIMADKHNVRSISSGKSAQFPAIGSTTAAYHTPGSELTGTVIPGAERVIVVDDLLVADTYIASIDEAKNHYDVRSAYSQELAQALARTYDSNVQQVLCLAARASATVSTGDGGSQLTNAGYANNGATIAAGVFSAAENLDTKNVPENDRYVNLRPAQYYLVAQTTNVINRDWGGAGVYAEGTVLKVAGVSFVKTNQLPNFNVTTGPSAYQGNFSNTQGVVYHKSAVGTVKLMDLGMEVVWDPRRRAWLLVAEYAMGHGILRPESSVELKSA